MNSQNLKNLTRDRLAMLANGYTPLLNKAKVCLLPGWPTMRVTEKTVLRWDRSKLPSTGMRIENGLAAVDLDISLPCDIGAPLLDALADAVGGFLPTFFDACLIRYSVTPKEAWFARVDQPFGHMMSRLWVPAGTDVNDPNPGMPSARVEIFGGLTARQFGVFGVHGFDAAGVPKTYYRWMTEVRDMKMIELSPATVPLAELPVYNRGDYGRICDTFDHLAETAGLIQVAPERAVGDSRYDYVLEPETLIELQDGGPTPFSQCVEAYNGAGYMRCSGSFHDQDRRRTDSHTFVHTRHGVGIHDFATSTIYLPKAAEAVGTISFAEAMKVYAEKFGLEPPSSLKTDPRPGRRLSVPLEELPTGDDQEENYKVALGWLLTECGYWPNALMGKAGVTLLHPSGGKTHPVYGIDALRNLMWPFFYQSVNKNGTVKRHNPFEAWLTSTTRINVYGIQLRPEIPGGVFKESGWQYVNTYAPVVHPPTGGGVDTFLDFLTRLIPLEEEREWFLDWLAHKVRHPEVPSIMIVMVAPLQGSGRGTLIEILGLLFGARYVIATPFSKLIGKRSGAYFNADLADALIVSTEEAVEQDGESKRHTSRILTYDNLKALVSPGREPKVFEAKGRMPFTQPPNFSVILMTNHWDAVRMPPDERRIGVLSNAARPMTPEERVAIRTWMASPKNTGALQRYLVARDLSKFDAYWAPMFASKRRMMAAAISDFDETYLTAIDTMGEMFTLTQLLMVMGHYGATGDHWQKMVAARLRQEGRRVRSQESGTDNRVKFDGRLETVHVRDRGRMQILKEADNSKILAALRVTQEKITTALADSNV